MDVVVASACKIKKEYNHTYVYSGLCGDDGRGIYELESCSNTN